VAAHPRNKLGPASTIPPQLLAASVSLARWRLLGRLAIGPLASQLITEARRKDYEDAMGQLRDVSAGRLAVEQPADEDVGPETITKPQGAFGSDTKEDF